MKIIHISHSDIIGGAARAAYRQHNFLNQAGHISWMLVQKKLSDDRSIIGPEGYIEKLSSLIKIFLGEQYIRLQRDGVSVHHTPSIGFSFRISPFLQQMRWADVVHLHWFRETPNIANIAQINKPVVWTLHDMWAFCGAEHYTSDTPTARWREGYTRHNRPAHEKGLDINRLTWKRKIRHWHSPMHIVTPSTWLQQCASKSALMRDWPVHVIPNVLDTNVFKPLNQEHARKTLNLPQNVPLILFGAIKGGNDPRKGFDLLLEALNILDKSISKKIQGVIFGQSKPVHPPKTGFPLHWMGHIHDEWTLALLYSSADIMVVPSRQENLPQTGTEAQSCGCPVVAFNATGLPDVVAHKQTGYLATPFDTRDLAHGISWILTDKERHSNLCTAARERAIRLWAPDKVIPQYLNVYQMAIEQHLQKTYKAK